LTVNGDTMTGTGNRDVFWQIELTRQK